MLAKNCPTCHTDIHEDGRLTNLVTGDEFTCRGCGRTFTARADLHFDEVGKGKATHNDPRTDEGRAAARAARSR